MVFAKNCDMHTLTKTATYDLFVKMTAQNHCLSHLLPLDNTLRDIGHSLQLPRCTYKLLL